MLLSTQGLTAPEHAFAFPSATKCKKANSIIEALNESIDAEAFDERDRLADDEGYLSDNLPHDLERTRRR